jgi:hypothetical protein
MFGNAMYEVAKTRIAEQERAARQAGEARRQRAEARSRDRKPRRDESALPSIPDYAEDLLAVARETVPTPREEAPHGGHARTGS